MIRLEREEVFNLKGALRGMRNPLNSWDKSDSKTCGETSCKDCLYYIDAEKCDELGLKETVSIGENDMDLAKRLIRAGSEHRKFLRQILVCVDITAPLYWWKEFDTYKVGTVANSCSTMHKIHAKEFVLDDFSYEHLDEVNRTLLQNVIDALNYERERFIESKYKGNWWQMIQLLPSSYNQKRTVTLNYEVLLNIYRQRKNHKLDEWRTLCDWIGTLPFAKELIIEVKQ